MRKLENIFWLGTKELRSFMRDFVLLGLVVYAFSLAIIAQAQSRSQEVHNASIAIVDEDHSELSRRIARAFLPPYFQPPQPIAERDVVPLMNAGRYTFIIDIPPILPAMFSLGASPRSSSTSTPPRWRRYRRQPISYRSRRLSSIAVPGLPWCGRNS